MEAELNESRTANTIWENLPLEGTVQTWGDEIYFGVDIEEIEEDPVSEVNVGDLAFWPDGKYFCIFFGETPISRDGAIIPAGPVNIIGKILDDPTLWRQVPEGTQIKVVKY